MKKLSKVKRILRYYVQNKLLPKQTYAQHREDIVIQARFGRGEKFIEIGANDGSNCSNPFLFSLKGASGLCFETVEINFFILKLNLPTIK